MNFNNFGDFRKKIIFWGIMKLWIEFVFIINLDTFGGYFYTF